MYALPGRTILPGRLEEVLQQSVPGQYLPPPTPPPIPPAADEYDASAELGYALFKTGRAFTAGIAIAGMDGPLPILDVIGLGYAIYGTFKAWDDYFEATS